MNSNDEENLPVIDWEAAVKQCEDEEFLIELLSDFSSECGEHMSELEKAVEAADAEKIKFHAHSIKGSAANLMLQRLRAASYTLERLGLQAVSAQMQADVLRQEAQQAFTKLQTECQAVMAMLRERGITSA